MRGRTAIALLAALAAMASAFLCEAGEKTVSLGPEAPFFEKPDASSKVLFVSGSSMDLPYTESAESLFLYPHLAERRWLPIGMRASFRKVAGPDGSSVWVSEDIKFDKEKGPVPTCAPRNSSFLLLFVCYVLLSLGLILSLRLGFEKLFAPGWKSAGAALWLLVSLRLCLASTVIYLAGGLAIIPTDECGYFQIGKDILSLSSPDPKWHYTIGTALWQAPFILALKAKDYFDVQTALSFFNCFATSPAVIALTWFIAARLSGSRTKAFVASALLAVFPFVSFPVELFADGVFKNVMALPDVNPGSYRLYDIFNHIGYNGLSDTPSTLACLLCIALALSFKAGPVWPMSVISALYAFACLLRINNIMLAPLMGFLLLLKLKEGEASPRRSFIAAATCVASFLAVFSPQLLANAMQLGSPLAFPYELHESGAAKGFLLSGLLKGADYLLGCNMIPACLLAAALPFASNARARTALCLWAAPLLIFFCGYPVVGASPTRFVLSFYPAAFAALVAASFWSGLGWKRGATLAGVLLACCALVSPCHRTTPPLPWDIESFAWRAKAALAFDIALPALCAATGLWLLKASKEAGAFLLLFGALYFAGSPVLTLACLAALLAWALADFAGEAALHFKARGAAQSSSSSAGQ